jgi:hypothetical protein
MALAGRNRDGIRLRNGHWLVPMKRLLAALRRWLNSRPLEQDQAELLPNVAGVVRAHPRVVTQPYRGHAPRVPDPCPPPRQRAGR